MQSRGSRAQDTSWGKVADWYADHLEGSDTYHAKVIIPNLLRVLHAQKGMRVLDLACGEGIVTREISKSGAIVHGCDISPELIAIAKEKGGAETYHVANAEKLNFAEDQSFDVIVCVLAFQNMEQLDVVFSECARVLAKGGRLVFVLNHPTFRIPKRSAWGFDESARVQYRRLDGYMSSSKEVIVAHPGKKESTETLTFHRPLQEWFKLLKKSGFVVQGCEEWISHKKSEQGPRAQAEDHARKEFPLFLMAEARLLT